ncbi:G1 family glutamic endopeptidase [Sulfobacillus thermosulfidooxidans]|uniref:G1 family glutamic endopeptidase n=1 Tax=Sulfobacillus thermosulfidooxidans TaxID=28034 RepID=UPI0006B4B8C6|nr:G1 family glutamic endopeptidase [Sulfobacillus thermosulfidooxidans]
MTRAKQEVASNPVVGTQKWASLSGTSAGNWAGYANLASNNGNITYDNVMSSWNVSNIPSNSSYSNSDWQNAPKVGMWTGLGGTASSNSGLVQAGTADIATATAQYRFWTEDAPYQNPVYEGPVVNADNQVFVEVTYKGDSSTSYFLENETTGQYSSFANYSPDYSGASADFIVETQGAYLPNFVGTQFSNCSMVWNNGTGTGNFDQQNYEKYIMEDNSGNEMAYPGSIQTSEDGFAVWWNSAT